jgi:predicted Ser/Thr protein kinase
MDKVGRYEIIGELGRGAMGVVYRAIDPTIGRTVALKTTRLDLDAIERDELLRRFRNEAHAAGQMNHPNIVTIHDAGECDGLFYIAMEYLEGETLQSLMAETHRIPTEQIVEIARQVATGLDYAHAMSVVHRDIKPANIMITSQKLAKIMDFGISKSVGTLTRTGQVFGTPYYMSPEQVMGHAVDGRSDLFSFGVVLYEMATGARPFGGDTVATVVYKIINEIPPSPCELQTGIDPRLSAVITRCLEKKPEDRYQTGAELADCLENFSSLHAGKLAATMPASNGALQRTQAVALAQAGPVATRQLPAIEALQPTAANTRATEHSVSGPARPALWLRTKRGAILASSAAFVMGVMLTLYGVRHHRAYREHLPGGASIIVNVPSNPAKHVRHEVSERREVQRVRGSGRPAPSSAAPIPGTEHTTTDQRPVSIYFTSNPAGASIRLDGESDPAWVTPYTIADIAPGTHRVVFAKEGYSPEIRDLEIGPRDASYKVDLAPK